MKNARIEYVRGQPYVKMVRPPAERRRILVTLLILLTITISTMYGAWRVTPIAKDWFDARWQVRQQILAAQVTDATQSKLADKVLSWMLLQNKKLSRAGAEKILATVFTQAIDKRVDPFTLLALIKVESNFNTTAVSKAGALGLTQVIPKWHAEKLRPSVHMFDRDENIRVGAEVLAQYLSWYGQDYNKALLQYNGSLKIPGAPYAKNVLAQRENLIKYLESGI